MAMRSVLFRGLLLGLGLLLGTGCYTQLQLTRPESARDAEHSHSDESDKPGYRDEGPYFYHRYFARFYGPRIGLSYFHPYYYSWSWTWYDPWCWDEPWWWDRSYVRITLIYRYPWWGTYWVWYHDPFWRPHAYQSPWYYSGLYRYRVPQPVDFRPRESGRPAYESPESGRGSRSTRTILLPTSLQPGRESGERPGMGSGSAREPASGEKRPLRTPEVQSGSPGRPPAEASTPKRSEEGTTTRKAPDRTPRGSGRVGSEETAPAPRHTPPSPPRRVDPPPRPTRTDKGENRPPRRPRDGQ
nr:MAG: hypothetical protein KatS3mg041_0081 [Bacteroidota bacterium]